MPMTGDASRRAVAALARLLLLAALAYAGYALLLFASQRAVMYPGAGHSGPGPATLPPGATRLALALPFGPVEAIHWRVAGDAPRGALILAHGNFEFVDQQLDGMAPFVAAGLDVLALEYPGYGRSAGRPGRAPIDAALAAAYEHLAAAPGVDPARIAVLGRSLGSGPVLALAASRPIAAAIVQSGYAAVADFARARGLPGFLVRDDWDNVAALTRRPLPLLLLHGRHDAIIPFDHAERLAAAAPGATLLALDCGHNDCPYLAPDLLAAQLDWLRGNGVLR